MNSIQAPDVSLSGENWVPIKDFPCYLISNYGRVWSTKSLRLLALNETHFCYSPEKRKLVHTSRGYLAVRLTDSSGKQRNMRVHRLVASHFVPNDDPQKNVVDHIDNDPFNNIAANLRWVTSCANLHSAVTEETQKYTRWLQRHLEQRDREAREC